MKLKCQNQLVLVAVAVLFSSLCGAAEFAAADRAPAETGKETNSFNSRQPRYRLDVGDELEIQFRFTPEFDQTLKIQPDGFITLLDVGDLKVSGLNVEEVRGAIIERYESILNEPVVSVTLKEFSLPYFIVGGEVTRPGKFDLRGELMMSDAIAMAGGFTVGARSSEVLLFRRVSKDQVEVKKVNLKLAHKGQIEENVRLRPGDSLFVPRSRVGTIDRFMDVTRLGLYFPLGF